jgi:hypothetical protein
MNSHTVTSNETHSHHLGNAAVDGLIAGAAGGFAMLVYLLVAMAILGEAPTSVLSRFASGDMQGSIMTGVVGHLAVSSIYGMLFALMANLLLRDRPKSVHVLGGAIFGLALFVFAEFVLLPAFHSPMLGIPALHFSVAHVIYGMVLGFLIKLR